MRKFISALVALVLLLSFSLVIATPAWANFSPDHYVDPAGTDTPPYDTWAKAAWKIQDAIALTNAGDTVHVAAATYSENITIGESITLQSVSGAATTIIDPGADRQGAVEISADNVTLDGFTVKHGTQAYSPANPQEHTIWVHANYSTIKNNTIIGAGGNQACLYIGGRTANVPAGAIYGYQVSTPLGHTIQDNTFRYAHAGEGWGIFAYDLSDSLIKGNQFVGDAGDVGNWDDPGNEGAPGTGIIIHKATAATGTPSPGGGYVVIENNTARYIKYTWLTFYSAYHYVDAAGKGYEQPEASTVNKVIVRKNTVYDCGKDANHTSGTAINFHRANKDDCYGTFKCAKLLIGSDNVTIGPGNNFYNNDYGIKVDNPKEEPAGCCVGVLNAEYIVINFNNIYDNASYGVFNGAMNNTVGTVHQDPRTVAAKNNWWGDATGPTHAENPAGTGDAVTDNVTYDPWLTASITNAKTQTFGDTYSGTVDAKNEADTEVDKSGGVSPLTITVAQYTGNPGGTPAFSAIGKYIDVHISSSAGLDEIVIKVYYTSAEIAGLDESSLKLNWWNGTSWVVCSDSGVNTTDIVGPPAYSGYIWAKITPTTTPNLTQLEGSAFGGGGAAAAAAAVSSAGCLPVISNLTITPIVGKIAEVKIAEPVTITAEAKNIGDAPCSYTVILRINGVVEEKKTVTLAPGEKKTVTFTVIEDEAGTYKVQVSSLKGEFTVSGPLLSPASFEVTDLSISPAKVEMGETVTIGVLVTETGGGSDNYNVTLKVNGVVMGKQEVTLGSQQSQTVTFTITNQQTGNHEVELNGLVGTFIVEVPPEAPSAPPLAKVINW
ncbi:MAG: hypothetical protein OEZ00_02940, partial [Dehalococcoidia bacterium]|nr:hypothetical protein [Dehalococcoidia bacterium]